MAAPESRSSRIVITGMGLVTPLGVGTATVWERLLAGQSGIVTNTRFDTSALPTHIAGLIPDIADDPAGLDKDAAVPRKEQKRMDLFTIYALAAAEEALSQAGWKPDTEEEQTRTATLIGTGIGGFPTVSNAKQTMNDHNYKRISPFAVVALLANLAAGNVTIRYGFKGPIGTPVTACAAGLQAIGDGMRLIRSGEADVVLAGGTEGCIDPLTIGGFAAARALSTRNDVPAEASRPFDKGRDGFIMSEGSGLVVLETLEHAEARGATPLVELTGYGTTADAHHLTAAPADGSGAARAIRAALASGSVSPDSIDYVNAHGTSTPLGDMCEIAALRAIFGDRLPQVPVSSTKSATGHMLGAAGGAEAIFTALALMNGTLPPTLNLRDPEEGLEGLDLVPLKSRQAPIRNALCNAFGFGGVNACLALRKLES